MLDSQYLSSQKASVTHTNASTARLTPTLSAARTTTVRASEIEPTDPPFSASTRGPSAVTLHTLSNVPHHFPTDAATTAVTTLLPAAAAVSNHEGNVTVVLNGHHRDPTPFYSSAVCDRFHAAASPTVVSPLGDSDDTSHDAEFLSGAGFLPFMSTSSRSRNSSGASSIEPSITIDPALLPFDLMQIFAQQGLTLAVTEVVPSSGNEDGT